LIQSGGSHNFASRRFVSENLISGENSPISGGKSAVSRVKMSIVSTLVRLMLKVHSVVVVVLHYGRLLVCIDEILPLY
jgi:hypothetical protein